MAEDHLDTLAIEVAVKVKQMHFQQGLDPLGLHSGAHAHIGDALELRRAGAGAQQSLHREDAAERRHIAVQLDVGSGQIQGPPQLAAIDHLAANPVGAAQELPGGAHVAGRKAGADACAADALALVRQRVEVGDRKALGLAGRFQVGKAALLVLAEAEVVAHIEGARLQVVGKEGDEALGRHIAGGLVELEAEHIVQPLFRQEFHLLAEAGQAGRGGEGVEEFLRLGLEADQHGAPAQRCRLGPRLTQNRLMAGVHAVKIADGDHAAAMPRAQVVEAPDHFHQRTSSRNFMPARASASA